MEEAITSLPGTLPVSFHSPGTRFFHTNCVRKRTPTAFLVNNILCSRTLEALSCFPSIFSSAVTGTWSARARTKKNTQKCQKRRFCNFCSENLLFQLKQVQKRTLRCNRAKLERTNDSPAKNTHLKNSFIPYFKMPILLK